MDRLLSMEIFVKTVEQGSLTKAADALHMSSQLVGKHLKVLEQQLGVQLLKRTTRRQHLTDIGSIFYVKAKHILAEVDAAQNLADETRAVPVGKLRINAPVTFGVHALAPKITDFMHQYPQISVELSLTNRKVALIEEGFDAVFRVGELSDSGLIARRLSPYRLILCASKRYLEHHPIISHPLDLQAHECLGFVHNELRSHWTFTGTSGVIAVPVAGRLMVDSGEALLAAALQGQGLLLQPAELVQKEISSGNLIELLPDFPVPTRPLHLLYTPDKRMTPALRCFINYVLEHFATPNSLSV